MADVNPEQFIITKKRKKYKFALFANSPICFELDEWKQRAVDVVEIGAGTGLFSVELATRYPDKYFVAVDVKADRLQKGAREATQRGLTNISFIRARVEDQLPTIFKKHLVQSIWITFPDPFPKKRSASRRLSHPQFLKLYARLLKLDGALYLKHDNHNFFNWSLEQLLEEKWHIDELSFDLHNSELLDDYKIMTTYETRWISEGLTTNFVKAHH
ncbi:MAG: tRNA (guanosine(46)-N7)-methyltransferase TrmB [Candidatus Saccharimonadales bacterium]